MGEASLNYSEWRTPYVYLNCLFLGDVKEVHSEQENSIHANKVDDRTRWIDNASDLFRRMR